jgi:diaminopimelate epimerase
MKFTKMNGLGNDYIFVWQPEEGLINPSAASKMLSDRHFSVGGDGLVTIGPSDSADFLMRIWNADGSEARMCGNAIRCVGKYVFEKGLTDKENLKIETLSGIKTLNLKIEDGLVKSVGVDIGSPEIGEDVSVKTSYGLIEVTPVNVGNPHAVIFSRTLGEREMKIAEEVSKYFPGGVNAEIVRVEDFSSITMRVFERGSGETLACGTGAAAAAYASFKRGYVGSSVIVRLAGGVLKAEYRDGRMFIEGTAECNYEGCVDI